MLSPDTFLCLVYLLVTLHYLLFIIMTCVHYIQRIKQLLLSLLVLLRVSLLITLGGALASLEMVESSLLQFYDNKT